MVAMVVKGDETSGGWKKRVVACPKALQDVSGRNTKLPVESPVASCRRLNHD